eukprot:s4417_g10.t1
MAPGPALRLLPMLLALTSRGPKDSGKHVKFVEEENDYEWDEHSTPATSSSSSSTAHMMVPTLCPSDQELEMMDANNVPGPAPSALPLPSWTWPEPTAETGENGGDEDSKKLEKKPTSLSGDWWEAVRDKRLLRGRRDRSSSSSSTDPPEQGGITQRFGRTRAGVDRWHHPDGTVRNRLRERLAAAQQEVEEETMESTPDTTDNALPPNHAPFAVEGWTQLDDGPAVTAVTFYGEKFHVWASGNNIAGDLGAEESTTAGDDCNGTVADTENGTSSSSESTQSVGFYRHGEWQPRERTPLEQRYFLELHMELYIFYDFHDFYIPFAKEDEEDAHHQHQHESPLCL